jgi:hypothetical protein
VSHSGGPVGPAGVQTCGVAGLDEWEQGWEGARMVRAPHAGGVVSDAAVDRVPVGVVHAVSYTHWDDPGPYRAVCGRWVVLQFEEPFTEAGACADCLRSVRAGD